MLSIDFKLFSFRAMLTLAVVNYSLLFYYTSLTLFRILLYPSTEMDQTTASGMQPEYVADEVVRAVTYYEKDVLMAPFVHRMAVYFKNMLPNVFSALMISRARKQRKEFEK